MENVESPQVVGAPHVAVEKVAGLPELSGNTRVRPQVFRPYHVALLVIGTLLALAYVLLFPRISHQMPL